MLYEYFTQGTQGTKTGGQIGMEIETDFLTKDGIPIGVNATRAILKNAGLKPKLELGRQKIELAIAPKSNFADLFQSVQEDLGRLYRVAAMYGGYPVFSPDFIWKGRPLLYVQEKRDEIWVALDGREALEHLCRCSSVQFTVDVNPDDAIKMINRLWMFELHKIDYAVNDSRWKAYMARSLANYLPDRYAGPQEFSSMRDYVSQLNRHRVVMHNANPVEGEVKPENVPDLNIDLFLRSVWWNYRLRRYGDTLALEMRPFARRKDEAIPVLWEVIANTINL